MQMVTRTRRHNSNARTHTETQPQIRAWEKRSFFGEEEDALPRRSGLFSWRLVDILQRIASASRAPRLFTANDQKFLLAGRQLKVRKARRSEFEIRKERAWASSLSIAASSLPKSFGFPLFFFEILESVVVAAAIDLLSSNNCFLHCALNLFWDRRRERGRERHGVWSIFIVMTHFWLKIWWDFRNFRVLFVDLLISHSPLGFNFRCSLSFA